MDNPIRSLRRSYNLTQRDLAEQAGMSATAILRYEQGLYQEISLKIWEVFLGYNDGEPGILHLDMNYRAWRNLHQKEASCYFTPLPQLAVRMDEHPFVTFRESVTRGAVGKESRISFCILLAVHPSVVLEYEKATQPHMPKLIQEGLANAGVPQNYINNLDQLGVVYYERKHRS